MKISKQKVAQTAEPVAYGALRDGKVYRSLENKGHFYIAVREVGTSKISGVVALDSGIFYPTEDLRRYAKVYIEVWAELSIGEDV